MTRKYQQEGWGLSGNCTGALWRHHQFVVPCTRKRLIVRNGFIKGQNIVKVSTLALGIDLAGFMPNPQPYTFMWEVEVGKELCISLLLAVPKSYRNNSWKGYLAVKVGIPGVLICPPFLLNASLMYTIFSSLT